MNALFRFYDISEGSISIGGVDIKSMSLESLRSTMVTLLYFSTLDPIYLLSL